MAHYKISSSSPTNGSHRLLIGMPLVVISVFCFGFVLMQPHDSNPTQTPAAAKPSPSPASAKASLPSIPSGDQQELTTLAPVAPIDASASAASAAPPLSTSTVASNTPVTSSPQLSNSGTTNLQAATQNSPKAITIGKNTPIKTVVKSLVQHLR